MSVGCVSRRTSSRASLRWRGNAASHSIAKRAHTDARKPTQAAPIATATCAATGRPLASTAPRAPAPAIAHVVSNPNLIG